MNPPQTCARNDEMLDVFLKINNRFLIHPVI